MKKTIILFLFFLLCSPQLFSQSFNWERVPYNEIDPRYYSSRGKLKLSNGDETNNVDMLIDFSERSIYYTNKDNNISYHLNGGDFSRVSIPEFKEGDFVPSLAVFGTLSDEIGAALRTRLYQKAQLNEITITSVVKQGFFNRGEPKFYVTNNGELDVSNKADILCKILAVTPYTLEYIDSEGEIWSRNWKKAKNITTNSDNSGDAMTKKREARKQARILNIFHKNNKYLSIKELYDDLYEDYEDNFYESIEDFKAFYVGKNITTVIKEWGPFHNRQSISKNLTQYVWDFQKSITESQSKSISTTMTTGASETTSSTNARASIYENLGVTTSSNINSNGLGVIVKSYGTANVNSFLNYYSKNYTSSRFNRSSLTSSYYSGTSITTDETSILGLLVNENNIVVEVITKNYFPEPEYGITISFIDY